MPLLSISDAEKLVIKVQDNLLISHNIVDRIQFPYFHSVLSVPQGLLEFKSILAAYRKKIVKCIAKLNKSPKFSAVLPAYNKCNDLSKGSVSHELLLSLTLASFGIGECGESTARLMIELSKAGYSDFARISVGFVNVAEGQEMIHSLIIANLAKPPSLPAGIEVTLPIFFEHLPKEAIVIDPFLGLCFKPNAVSPKFGKYIAAYGSSTLLMQFQHFYNVSTTLFNPYLTLSEQVRSALVQEGALPSLKNLPLKTVKSESKRRAFDSQYAESVTLPIHSQQAGQYLSDLDLVLGEMRKGEKIVKKDEKTKQVSFPSFWLNQLGKDAVKELCTQLSVTPEQLFGRK